MEGGKKGRNQGIQGKQRVIRLANRPPSERAITPSWQTFGLKPGTLTFQASLRAGNRRSGRERGELAVYYRYIQPWTREGCRMPRPLWNDINVGLRPSFRTSICLRQSFTEAIATSQNSILLEFSRKLAVTERMFILPLRSTIISKPPGLI